MNKHKEMDRIINEYSKGYEVPHIKEYARRLRERKIPKVSRSERSKLQEGSDKKSNNTFNVIAAVLMAIGGVFAMYQMVGWFVNHVAITIH